jgi:hypothetical protein
LPADFAIDSRIASEGSTDNTSPREFNLTVNGAPKIGFNDAPISFANPVAEDGAAES